MLPDRSILKGQKLLEMPKSKKVKWDILSYFQTMWKRCEKQLILIFHWLRAKWDWLNIVTQIHNCVEVVLYFCCIWDQKCSIFKKYDPSKVVALLVCLILSFCQSQVWLNPICLLKKCNRECRSPLKYIIQFIARFFNKAIFCQIATSKEFQKID